MTTMTTGGRLTASATTVAASLLAACGGGGGSHHASPPAEAIVRVDRIGTETTTYDAHAIGLSGDGRYAVFTSSAGELIPESVYHLTYVRIYRKDLATGAMLLVSRPWGPTGYPSTGYPLINADTVAPSMSDDGRFIAFQTTASLDATDANTTDDIYVVDLQLGLLERMSVGPGGVDANAPCVAPRISGDGSTVVFQSSATNLVAGDGNASIDVFARRRSGVGAGATRRLSVDSSGVEHAGYSIGASVNRDGTYVAFQSHAALVSADTNVTDDVYRAHVDWSTAAAPLVGRVSRGWSVEDPNGACGEPRISADGSKIAFTSTATNLVASDPDGHIDVFLFDYVWVTTARVSVPDAAATEPDGDSNMPAISGDGRYVVFESRATNLVTGDSNAGWDVFVRDTTLNHTRRLSVGAHGEQNDGDANAPAVSADGSTVGFEAQGTVLPGESAAKDDVYRVLNAPSAGG